MRNDSREEPSANEAEKLAEKLAGEPERDEAMSLVIDCWHRLGSDRPVVPFGMGGSYRGEIPSMAVDGWCRRNGLDAELALLIDDCIRYLDGERSEDIRNQLATKG